MQQIFFMTEKNMWFPFSDTVIVSLYAYKLIIQCVEVNFITIYETKKASFLKDVLTSGKLVYLAKDKIHLN